MQYIFNLAKNIKLHLKGYLLLKNRSMTEQDLIIQ